MCIHSLAKTQQTAVARRDAITTDLFDRFIAFLDASPQTVATYSRALRQFGRYLSANGISRPTRDDVITFRSSLRETHKPATVQLYIVAVRQLFTWAAGVGLYPNIAENVKGVKLNRGHKRDYLASEQARAVLAGIDRENLQGVRDYAMLSLMLTTGLRTIEVVRANMEDLRTVGDCTVLYIQGKRRGEKAEFVKISAPVKKAIRAYLSATGPVETGRPLFRSLSNQNAGHRLTTRSVSGIVKTRLRAAGYDSDRLIAHSLRHTAVTLALMQGEKLEDVQLFARHISINTTLIYAHNITTAANSCAASVSGAIFN